MLHTIFVLILYLTIRAAEGGGGGIDRAAETGGGTEGIHVVRGCAARRLWFGFFSTIQSCLLAAGMLY